MTKLSIFLITLSSAIISFMITFLIRKVALKHNIIDIPNKRSSHTIPTPRGGGISFFIVWMLSINLLFFLKVIPSNLYFALICVIPIGIISLIDEVISLTHKIRLIVQLLSSILAIYFLGGIGKIDFGIFSFTENIIINICLVFFVVWFINLYNFLDGIDAYASLEAIFISIGLILLSRDNILLILIASILGFLYWNWPKAKIFMGDVGSTVLGFTLIIIGVYYNNVNNVNILYWLTLSSLFWFDATITLIRRKLNHENISQPHKKHAYQRITQAGISHLKTGLISVVINIFLIVIVLANKAFMPMAPYLSLITAFFINFLLYRIIEKVKPFH